MSVVRRMSLITAALLCAGGLVDRVDAQTVTVRVVDEAGSPLAGAIVHLEDSTEATISSMLTDSAGAVLFFQFGLGQHRARAEMIGMGAEATPTFTARAGQREEFGLTLRPEPIRLEGLAVEASERCRVGAADGLVAEQLWTEARRALTSVVLADDQAMYRYQTMLYEQDLDMNTQVVRRSRQSRREAHMRTPFHSRPADLLAEDGYTERVGVETLYFAPDAGVLLSDEFLETHCFRPREGDGSSETEQLVGLSFEPAPGLGSSVDISGTLWLDPATAELQWLDFRYVNLDPLLQHESVGGRVDFRRMPNGGWIIPEWQIRMPRPSRQLNLAGDNFRTYLAGFSEAGGAVLEVQGVGRVLGHQVNGSIEGVVRDSVAGPRGGVEVEVLGTEMTTLTDSLGAYRFSGLIQGVYEIAFTDPALDQMGIEPTVLTRAVINGEVTDIDLRLPSVALVVVSTCREAEEIPEWVTLAREFPSAGIVYGWLRDADGRPLEGVTVQVMTPTVNFRPGPTLLQMPQVMGGFTLGGVNINESQLITEQGSLGLQTTTNERGFYRICRLPEGHRFTVTALVDGIETETGPFVIETAGGLLDNSIRIGPVR